MELGIARTPPDDWCFICQLCHVSLLDQHQRLEGWHHRWKHLACICCEVWTWYSCDLQAIFGNVKEVPLLECDTYCLLFLPSLFQHIFEFVKNIEVHDGPIEDLTFDRFFLRVASTGAGYPQVWGPGQCYGRFSWYSSSTLPTPVWTPSIHLQGCTFCWLRWKPCGHLYTM